MNKTFKNWVKIELAAKSENEGFARSAVAAFAAQLNPTVNEVNDLKTAVSEAVTNCVVHAYSGGLSKKETVVIECELSEREIIVTVTDFGIGINDIQRAMEPFYTTRPDDERSGMGFTVMQSFMDSLDVKSSVKGTVVRMTKTFQTRKKESKAGVKSKAIKNGFGMIGITAKDKESKVCGG